VIFWLGIEKPKVSLRAIPRRWRAKWPLCQHQRTPSTRLQGACASQAAWSRQISRKRGRLRQRTPEVQQSNAKPHAAPNAFNPNRVASGPSAQHCLATRVVFRWRRLCGLCGLQAVYRFTRRSGRPRSSPIASTRDLRRARQATTHNTLINPGRF